MEEEVVGTPQTLPLLFFLWLVRKRGGRGYLKQARSRGHHHRRGSRLGDGSQGERMSSDGVAGEAAKMQVAPPASTESFEVYKKKQAVAPPTSASGVPVVDAMLAPGQKRKTPEEEELAKKRAKAGEKGEDGPSGGIKEATPAGASVVPMAMVVGDRVGGKVLPKEPSVLNPMVESAMSKHGAATTVRQIREHLISMGYSRDSVVEAKELLKEIGNSIYPDANKGEGIRDGDKDGDKAGGKDKIGNVGMAQGNLTEGNKKERTGRFTKEEDELLLNAINAAIGKLQSDVDIEAFKAALCGPKARGEARKKTVSEVRKSERLSSFPRPALPRAFFRRPCSRNFFKPSTQFRFPRHALSPAVAILVDDLRHFFLLVLLPVVPLPETETRTRNPKFQIHFKFLGG